jgi:type II secretory pathway pseudopilin PulG
MSLSELLIVCALLSVVIGAMFLLMGTTQNITNMSSARAQASDEAQGATDLIARDLRQAQENPDPTPGATLDKGALTIATATQMQFYADVDHNGKPDLITYSVVDGSLYRSVTPPTNNKYQYTYGTLAPGRRIVKKIDTTYGPFCYHTNTVDSTNAACAGGQKHGFTAVPFTTDALNTSPKICLVGIRLANSATSGDQTVNQVTSVLVKIRSIASKVVE